MNENVPVSPLTARVMLVDDEESIRHAVYELLASEEIYALTAAGADECLEFLRGGFRGVILMDVMMPKMNGWETIREIQKSGLMEGNLISMLTAMDIPDSEMDGLQEIVIDYITKPFEPLMFIDTVKKYLFLHEQVRGGN
jgi:DNA-binding response OmpR family regulator